MNMKPSFQKSLLECLNIDFGVNFISNRCKIYFLYLKLGTSKIRCLNKDIVRKGKKKKKNWLSNEYGTLAFN